VSSIRHEFTLHKFTQVLFQIKKIYPKLPDHFVLKTPQADVCKLQTNMIRTSTSHSYLPGRDRGPPGRRRARSAAATPARSRGPAAARGSLARAGEPAAAASGAARARGPPCSAPLRSAGAPPAGAAAASPGRRRHHAWAPAPTRRPARGGGTRRPRPASPLLQRVRRRGAGDRARGARRLRVSCRLFSSRRGVGMECGRCGAAWGALPGVAEGWEARRGFWLEAQAPSHPQQKTDPGVGVGAGDRRGGQVGWRQAASHTQKRSAPWSGRTDGRTDGRSRSAFSGCEKNLRRLGFGWYWLIHGHHFTGCS
jgi:hypothetical protein